jgi:fibronectin type III domain protein
MRVFLASILLGLCAFAFAPAALADTPIVDCDETTGPPCFVSITKNGTTPLEQNPILDTGVEVITGLTFVGSGTRYWQFSIQDEHGDYALNTSDTYEIVLDVGTANPAETFTRGKTVVVDRDLSVHNHHMVTFTMNPVRVAYSFNGCHANGTCDPRPDVLAPGYLEGWVDNLGFVTDPADEAAMQGWDLTASTDWISSPPTLNFDTHTFFVDVANSHCEEPTGPACTPFVGSVEMTFPFAMLSHLYDVDDPASLGPTAFSFGGIGAGTATVTVNDAGHTVHVEITDLTFSKHRLKIVGNMRPGRVKNLEAIRVSGNAGKIKFDPAQSRGSKVRGYKATCKSGSGLVATGSADASPLKVTGLSPGVKYECKVWAKSRFGDGAKRGVDMPRG